MDIQEFTTQEVIAKFVLVTPELASAMIDTIAVNRNSAASTVDAYADAMRKNKWQVTHQGIAFTNTGNLIDGEHRLHAIIKSKQPQQILVVTGLDDRVKLVIDAGRRRNDADRMRIFFEDASVTTYLTAVIKAFGSRQKLFSVAKPIIDDLLIVYSDYYAAIIFSVKHLRSGFSAPVRAAVASAHAYGIAEEKLVRFCEVLQNGITNGENGELSIIKLRDFLAATPRGGSRAINDERYKKTERAIRAFIDGENLSRIQEPKGELFPCGNKHRVVR